MALRSVIVAIWPLLSAMGDWHGRTTTTPLVRRPHSEDVLQRDSLDFERREKALMRILLISSALLLLLLALLALGVAPITIQPPLKMMAAARLTRRSLIVDTDVAFDDMVALLCLHQSPAVTLELITTVGGVNGSPRNAARCLQRMLPSIPVVAGLSSDRSGNESPPLWLSRQRSNLNLYAKDELNVDSNETESSGSFTANAITRILNKKQDASVDLLCLGPLTNVASWLQSPKTGALISRKIRSIYIMGGNSPSHAVKQAEFNFEQDPKAASQVFTSVYTRDKLNLVPQETCLNTVGSSLVDDVQTFASQYPSNILARTIPWDEDSLVFDPLTAFCYMDLSSCQMQGYNVKVDKSCGILSEAESSSSTQVQIVTSVEAAEYVTWLKRAIQNEL